MAPTFRGTYNLASVVSVAYVPDWSTYELSTVGGVGRGISAAFSALSLFAMLQIMLSRGVTSGPLSALLSSMRVPTLATS